MKPLWGRERASATPADTWGPLREQKGVFLSGFERVSRCIAGFFTSDHVSQRFPASSGAPVQCESQVHHCRTRGSVRDARGLSGVAQERLGSVCVQFRTRFVVYRWSFTFPHVFQRFPASSRSSSAALRSDTPLQVHGGVSGTPAATWELLRSGWEVFLSSLEQVLLCIANPAF